MAPRGYLERGYDEEVGAAGEGIRAPKDPRHFAGTAPITLPVGDTTITVPLNMDMNPEQLIIPDVFAPNVAVVSAKIGPIELNAGDGPMPGDAFRRDSTLRFRLAVAATSNQPLRVTIRNISTAQIGGFHFGVVGPVKRSA